MMRLQSLWLQESSGMIYSQLKPGMRVHWRGQGLLSHERGMGILFSVGKKHYNIFCLTLASYNSISKIEGVVRYLFSNILITEVEEIFIEELLTHDLVPLRNFAADLLKKQSDDSQ